MAEKGNEVVDMPKWDVALALLVRDEYQHKGEALDIDDITRLAREHAIRFDDIMETVFALCIHGQWRYVDATGNARSITQDEVDKTITVTATYTDDQGGSESPTSSATLAVGNVVDAGGATIADDATAAEAVMATASYSDADTRANWCTKCTLRETKKAVARKAQLVHEASRRVHSVHRPYPQDARSVLC